MNLRNAILILAVMLIAAPTVSCAIDVVSVASSAEFRVQPEVWTPVTLQVSVKEGYHVQANPVANPDLIPITLKITETEEIAVGETYYPNSKRMRLPGDKEDLLIYDGTFAITVTLRARHVSISQKSLPLKGTLRYQACDDRRCLFPVALPVTLAVRVLGH